MMKLQAFVSLMLLAGGLPSALARMPFEADFGARLVPTLPKDPQASALPGSRAAAGDKASTTTNAIVGGAVGDQESSIGDAGR
jgi:hypothetical protein